jgi:ribonucleoside-diphosphate reductase alpha chain
VVNAVMGAVNMEHSAEAAKLFELVDERKFLPGGRYLYASGRDLHQVQNCALYRAEDTREGWADLIRKCTMALMTGAGVGVDYSDVRCSGSSIARTGGTASGPISLMKMVNETGRNVMQGGSRRSAIWAGLAWWHADVFDFIRAKDWSPQVRALKDADFTFPADLDMTNISVILDKPFFEAYNGCGWASKAPDGRSWREWAHEVYRLVIDKMLTTGEPGFSVNYDDPRESLRNACTEVTSADDSDICNLGSLNLARFESGVEFNEAVELSTLFLMAGTVYSDLPHPEVYDTRQKNRRLGLGLLGVHEWLLKRGKRYGPDPDLGQWLNSYVDSSYFAHVWAMRLGLTPPVKTRAIAPNGTIGILAETTTSAEPIFAAAYKRRVRNAHASGDKVEFEYVVDPTAARLVEQGVDSSLIEDAYSLAYDVERRVEFQAWMQQYVDHGISSTVNLPGPIRNKGEQQEFGEMLLQYLPHLRGITCYPDGARGGQPLTSVPLEYALDKTGVRFEENEERCVGGACGV